MTAQARILVVGRDSMLLRTRQWILQEHFHVEIAGNETAVATLLLKENFDLVILCHSLKTEECRAIVELVRARASRAKILALDSGGVQCGASLPDDRLDYAEGPNALLSKAVEMVHGPGADTAQWTSKRVTVLGMEKQDGSQGAGDSQQV
jgi:DNA-binding NtrC family response regulator